MNQTAEAIQLPIPTEHDIEIAEFFFQVQVEDIQRIALFAESITRKGDVISWTESVDSKEVCVYKSGRASVGDQRVSAAQVVRDDILADKDISDALILEALKKAINTPPPNPKAEHYDPQGVVSDYPEIRTLKSSLRPVPTLTLKGYGGGVSDGWEGDVEPISAATAGAADYPLKALPGRVLNAIEEAQRGTRSPIPMVACSLLAAGSAAIQSIVEVERPSGDGCRGGNLPVSLWFLIAAESGERKTTTDKIFSTPIREFGDQAVEITVAEEPAGSEGGEPKKITRRKQLLVNDPTAEGLRDHTHGTWPAPYIQSSEGSTILGGHSLRDSQRAAGLGAFNGLWDGEGSYVVRAGKSYKPTPKARATVSLAIQPEILGGLTGSDSSSSGFYPRFLISVPPSNIGTRFIDLEAKAPSTPALDAMLKTIRDLLEVKEEWDEKGYLVIQRALPLEKAAKTVWAEYYNEIEEAQAEGGEYEGHRGFASKAAEQVLRLAAVIHVLEGGHPALSQPISAQTIKAATMVMDYHLEEAMRLDLAVSPKRDTERKAAALEKWLLEQGKGKPVPINDILQRGPNSLREKEARDRAIAHLKERNRWREVKSGRMVLLETREAVLRERGQ